MINRKRLPRMYRQVVWIGVTLITVLHDTLQDTAKPFCDLSEASSGKYESSSSCTWGPSTGVNILLIYSFCLRSYRTPTIKGQCKGPHLHELHSQERSSTGGLCFAFIRCRRVRHSQGVNEGEAVDFAECYRTGQTLKSPEELNILGNIRKTSCPETNPKLPISNWSPRTIHFLKGSALAPSSRTTMLRHTTRNLRNVQQEDSNENKRP